MSYEEIDRSSYGKDVFTNGAEGRYTRPKPISINGTLSHSIETSETKKRVPKAVLPTTDNPTEELYENGHSDTIVKTKKKTRKVHENGEIQNGNTISEIDSTIVKPKKKRAPKIDLNNENIDPMPTTATTTTTTTEEPIKKKKSKVPKPISIEEEFQLIDTSTMNELEEPSIEKKVKKTKRHKTPKTSTKLIESFDDLQMNNLNEHATNSGMYLFKYIYMFINFYN
ncbi:unnamed protein product [Rotaria sordida]|uniref:Uncharacterized protein n=1 Tax=Rotaria sordida TaxID=392033 RepID=A0A814E4L8_9BILA|nr:unnamed protein product [Rotaria sordida]